ncbi:hypothetical protein MKK88_23095 [Methylobacterium sp. E-005]|uniref:hypothetical protein n=1 Tax=Methylobacterium sp. E-005 TaxID=2836549 RepID=UPI001FB8A8B2|nr:hypothetical protein [Methylobacterium sp. E-005]MCJ2088843.1 hypothetical protein [Methylobacterium sp. E-005]
MKSVRKHREAGQDYRSDDSSIAGVVIQLLPGETSSEALIPLHSTSDIVRLLIPGEDHP